MGGTDPIGDAQVEGHELIAWAYLRLRVAEVGQLRAEECDTLEAFQAAFGAADEWEALGLIELLELPPRRPWQIPPIRFRRLK